MRLLTVAVHTALILAFLMVGLRTVGRRALAQLDVIDLVVVLLLGSAVETAMVAGDTSLQAGLVSAGTLLVLDGTLARSLARSPRLRHVLGGVPLLLVHDGVPIASHLRRVGLTADDLAEALRQRGEPDLDQILEAVLEPDGTVHVIPPSPP